jgi:hypothetical protein
MTFTWIHFSVSKARQITMPYLLPSDTLQLVYNCLSPSTFNYFFLFPYSLINCIYCYMHFCCHSYCPCSHIPLQPCLSTNPTSHKFLSNFASPPTDTPLPSFPTHLCLPFWNTSVSSMAEWFRYSNKVFKEKTSSSGSTSDFRYMSCPNKKKFKFLNGSC